MYVVAGLFDLAERFEVAQDVMFHVRSKHVLQQRWEIFQLERIARYRELELPVIAARNAVTS